VRKPFKNIVIRRGVDFVEIRFPGELEQLGNMRCCLAPCRLNSAFHVLGESLLAEVTLSKALIEPQRYQKAFGLANQGHNTVQI
jgi:hypothetical protein